MAESGILVAERVRGQRVVKPIIYGNTARKLPRHLDNNHTHSWTIYIRSLNEEELSVYIRKVQFKLHESYANPLRVLDQPPFEITETGWGEFEVQIKLYFVDVNEKPVTAFYYLKLFQPLVTLQDGLQVVFNEYYDEIVFNEPTEQMYRLLTSVENPKPIKKRIIDYEQVRRQTKEKLEAANKEILNEIADLRGSLKDALELIQKSQRELQTQENTPENMEIS